MEVYVLFPYNIGLLKYNKGDGITPFHDEGRESGRDWCLDIVYGHKRRLILTNGTIGIIIALYLSSIIQYIYK